MIFLCHLFFLGLLVLVLHLEEADLEHVIVLLEPGLPLTAAPLIPLISHHTTGTHVTAFDSGQRARFVTVWSHKFHL